ncbi:hypothetical protein P691DRAFT_804184 [Macrolepiota fuliginosa MF-IS2]|uniref:Sensitive to high expression protein 9, mitochondrial n=1 Tax=Macrolepiota fuliginosa MF-IS2 TaxID=1400762 RepID=A0A9P6CB66_9AGAR|nr:hypothetical protein P691DRAFT_804184 [Macrolepiota fuliginosa MF-IS2]
MLPVRSILSRRIVTRSYPTTWSRLNSTRPTGTQSHDALDQGKLEKDSSTKTENVIPLDSPPSPQESLSAESTPTPSAVSSSAKTSTPAPDATSDKPDSWKDLSAYDLEVVKQRIRDWTDQAAITLRERADDFTVQTKTTFSQLGAHLNKVTGYEGIDALKREVVDQEEKIKLTREAAKQAKLAYEQAVIQRSNSQREVNDLLQRKSLWTDSDVGRFTTLVRQDHLYEQEEVRAKAAVDETEAAVEREFTQLMKSILNRYHEEQVWSDKIRSASTYGSLAALGLNLLVFILAIVIVEPWKRKRLAQTFEAKIEELSRENAKRLEGSMKAIGEKFVEQEGLLGKVLDEIEVMRESAGRVGVVDVQRAIGEEKRGETPTEIVETPVPPERVVYLSIPGVPMSLPQRTFHLAAVGLGAFVLGVTAAAFVQ